MLSCEFCEISINTFFHRTPLMAASHKPSIKEQPSQDKEFLTANLCLFRSSKKLFQLRALYSKRNLWKNIYQVKGILPLKKKETIFLKTTSLLATLAWQIAKQLQGLNFFSPSNNKNYRLTKDFFFLINVKQLLNRQCIKIQLPQKHYWESFKITDQKYRFWILKITVFFMDIGYLIKLLSNH